MRTLRPLDVTVEDACFCHWPVDADALAAAVPDWLTVERFDGTAWVTALAHTVASADTFGVSLTRPAEWVNVRTPVRGPDGQRGVRFLAVYTADEVASALGGPGLGLPIREGEVTRADEGSGRRRRTLTADGRRVFDVRYTPGDGDPGSAPPDSLARFLVERERYFASDALGTRLVGSVSGDDWPLAPVAADAGAAPLDALSLPPAEGDPVVHYSPGKTLSLAPPVPVWLD
ncbi:DUF2071 domain-containing protein [Haloarcula litorea]|uniref:DUF2071 domain-containing protein n=1 Tax=Haloarcula litorea TaxID=3032579 RepID=UPI0023E8DE10|nr:DUF2071 domain-containing protein [Halomicroarcula sp. GDY20]